MSGAADPRSPFGRYRDLMASHGFRPSRRLGQNFLLEPSLHRAIADVVDVGADDLVLEVGPGLGFLTRELASRARAVVAVEIDPRLARILTDELRTFRGGDRVRLVVADVLGGGGVIAPEVELALAAERREHTRWLVVANLPYAVTGPFLAAVVQCASGLPDAMALLVQLELAERLAAPAGATAYGGLSALLQAGYDVELVRTVGRDVFRPRPNVDSAVIRLLARPGSALAALDAEQRGRFARFVRAVFAARRKTFRHGIARAERELGLRFAVRADLLSLRAEVLSGEALAEVFRGGVEPAAPE